MNGSGATLKINNKKRQKENTAVITISITFTVLAYISYKCQVQKQQDTLNQSAII